MNRLSLVITALVAAIQSANALTIGSPAGMATGTTGGGDVTPVYPTTTKELVAFLRDPKPQVVVLNTTFDFRTLEGNTTAEGCRPDYMRKCIALNNGFKSQDVILQDGGMANTGGCTNGVSVNVTYDNAPFNRINVRGNKTIRGVGKSGVIMGKGLALNGDNIIVQNIHITDINPHLVWGGDAITIQGLTDGTVPLKHIWLDHIKISRIGRQFLAVDKAGASSMTISNSDFDGHTEFSKTCDGHHYWSFLLYGKHTGISIINNYIHYLSGRLPKVGGTADSNVVTHIANNFYKDNSYHSMEIGTNAYVLAEGNYFANTTQPLYDGDDPDVPGMVDGSIYAPLESSEDECTAQLGRLCEPNVLEDSGAFGTRNGSTALAEMKSHPTIAHHKTQQAQQLTLSASNFGVGDLE
ncbi:Pectate lyase [Phytophthora palmivora]|uniref:pectin lyase n=1 Tax=Phytophthora palmivora TaxID=4796 RepID=A0A2P4YIW5_9STRA|nr:Pectate lyase [Phytophthora palmivora]